MSKAYYNENDEYTATWLENLIHEKLIAPGYVDRRDVAEVKVSDLKGFTQHHFFAGIGGWSCGLRLCGWRDSWPVWTISCPCPPWSKIRVYNRNEQGTKDYRDLWPYMVPLIKGFKPTQIFGEQVVGKKNAPWIERTARHLQKADYNFIQKRRYSKDSGAPQVRQRIYFSADTGGPGRTGLESSGDIGKARSWRWRGEKDLRIIVKAPFKPGNRWPQPLLRRSDDGLFAKMGRLRAYGNSVDPFVAAQFISSVQEEMR